jgi:hypothetical protein
MRFLMKQAKVINDKEMKRLLAVIDASQQKAYHWRIFTPANNQDIWPLQWWIIAPAFSANSFPYGD